MAPIDVQLTTVCRYKYSSISYRFRAMLMNIVTLKSALGVTQSLEMTDHSDHWPFLTIQ